MADRENPSRYEGRTKTSRAAYTSGMSSRLPRNSMPLSPASASGLSGSAGPTQANRAFPASARAASAYSRMPFSATCRPTPATSSSSSPTPRSARIRALVLARSPGPAANRVRSTPLPTTRERRAGTARASARRSSPFW